MKVDYYEYIESEAWKARRNLALERCGHKCQLCSRTDGLQVHHNSYENLGNELDEDLIVLCRRCHEAFHAKVDNRTRKKMSKRARRAPMPRMPAPPVIVNPPRVLKGWKSYVRNGVMKRIEVTQEFIDSLIPPRGGITARGIFLLGLQWPPRHGWKLKVLGTTVEVDEGMLEAELSEVRGKAVRSSWAQTEPIFTVTEVREILDELNAFRTPNYRQVGEKWKCSKLTLKRILRGMYHPAPDRVKDELSRMDDEFAAIARAG